MNTIEKVKQWFIDRDLENGRVVVGMRGLKTRKSSAMSTKIRSFWRSTSEIF